MNKAIEELERFISQKLDEIEEDKTITKTEKVDVIDVYFNTYKFLKDYKENVKVLNKEIVRRKFERGE